MVKPDTPITINHVTLKNRMTYAPTVKFDYAGKDGLVTDRHIDHYRERAEHGIGLICVEATAVTPDGRFGKNHLGLWEDAQTEGHRRIVQACHENGVPVIIQLNHTGITANPECGPAIGPSAVPTRSGGTAKEMTVDEIHEMQSRFLAAALRAKDAGYDGVQLHGCHGYLINQFLCPKTNLRSDEYGGSAVSRARFGAEIIRQIRASCGNEFLISIRTPGADPDPEDAIAAAEEYVKAGCDYLQVSHGITDPSAAVPAGELKACTPICAMGVYFHGHFAGRVPVSAVNGIFEPDQVRYLIENELADTVDLARAELADPAFPEAVLYGTPYVKCFQCRRCQYGPFTEHRCPAEMKRKRLT